jgi:LPS-assembly lipoprotein
MLLCDMFKVVKAIAAASCIMATGAALTACQVRPLYSQSQPGAQSLSQVAFAPATDRLSQQIRNNLIFLTGNGAGESQNPLYEVELTKVSSSSGEVLSQATGSILPARLTLAATYILKKADDGTVLQSKSLSIVTLVDFPTQQFAKIRAIRDADDRAAKEAAEQIRADLAIYFGTKR